MCDPKKENRNSEEQFLLEDVKVEVGDEVNNALPQKSQLKYEKEYAAFQRWKTMKNFSTISEKVLLAYFLEKSKKSKLSLWSYYSMLKATLLVKENCDISKYSKLAQFLKENTSGHKPKKSKVFEREDILRFLKEAPDDTYLFEKVAAILGLYGACRSDELHKLQVCNVEDRGSVIIVSLVDNETNKDRSFCIADQKDGVSVLEYVRKYMALRPVHVPHNKFFISYRLKKCTIQPVGINTLYKVPQTIANFLNLENPQNYTGRCFRRSAATMLADASVDLITLERVDGTKSSSVAETYVEESVFKETAVSEQVLVSAEENNASHISSTRPSTSLILSSSCENGDSSVPVINVSNNQNCTFNIYINSNRQA